MVRIPRITPPARTITSQTPSQLVKTPSSTGEVLQILGKAGQEVGEKLKIANTITEKTIAENERDTALMSLYAEAEQDPDTSETRRRYYESEIEKSIKSSANNITIPSERNSFILNSQPKATVTRFKIQASMRKKAIENGKAALETYLENKENEYLQAVDLNNKRTAILERDKKILEAVEAGYLTKLEAFKRIKKLNNDWAKEQVYRDIEEDPHLTEKNIINNVYGDLSPEERNDLLNIVEKAKKQREKEIEDYFKDIKAQTEDKLMEEYFKGDLKIGEIEKQLSMPEAKGGADRNLLIRLRDKLYNEYKVTAKEVAQNNPKAREFVMLFDQVLDSEIDLIRGREILIDVFSDGVISKEEALVMDKIKNLAQDIRFNRQSSPFINAVKKIKSITNTSNEPTEELAKDLREFLIEMTSEGVDPEKVSNRIIQQRYKKNYPEYSDWEENKTYESIIGSVRKLGIDNTDGMPIVEVIDGK